MDTLVKRAQRRDTDAFTMLIQSQMQSLYKTAWAILEDDEDAADAISDTVLACWEKIGQLKNPEYFKTWMARILINKCKDILKQRRRVYPSDEIKEVSSLAQEYENVEWMELMSGLDEKYRLIMVLHYVNGFKTSEISDILCIPDSTVRTRFQRGREQMASLYGVEA